MKDWEIGLQSQMQQRLRSYIHKDKKSDYEKVYKFQIMTTFYCPLMHIQNIAYKVLQFYSSTVVERQGFSIRKQSKTSVLPLS